MISLLDKTETHFDTVEVHNWVSLIYCGFNLYLVISRLTHEENVGVCDHEITQIMKFAETRF